MAKGADGLAISDGIMYLRGDFAHMLPRLRPGNLQRELLVRAAKVKGVKAPLAIDATAGLGEDSLLLAAAGFTVLLYERNPVIAALLEDALERARLVPELADAACRMTVVEADSVDGLSTLARMLADQAQKSTGIAVSEGPHRPDVVLLDPMFPQKQKSSSVKKKLQLLQRLERPCDDESALLDAALSVSPRKVVVKRPVKGPYLAGRKPDYSLAGKAVRYDCIVLAR